MQNVFRFFLRNFYFILFLLLEIMSLTLVLRQNFYHRSVFFNSTNVITGNFMKTFTSVKDYFYLREINRQLVEENAILKSYHKSSFVFDDRNSFVRNDTTYDRKFTYIPAKVVNNSIYRPNNYLTLNIGSDQGVQPGMGVISPAGVVGIVKDVSANFSSVYSLLHSDSKISGNVGNDQVVGTILWTGEHYRRAELRDIAKHHQIEKGDTVFTSSFSQIFPPNIPIGFINSFEVNKAYDFYEIDIDLATDFSKVSEVYVIIAHKSEEQLKLEGESQNE